MQSLQTFLQNTPKNIKRMFVNSVSVKELFSNSQRQSRDSALESSSQSNHGHSQIPYSQVDFPDSQDFSSQTLSSGMSQANDSPGKKMYNRYAPKGQNVGQARGHNVFSGRQANYQQQLQANRARARERDERDFLNNIVMTVSECADDIKSAVAAVKDNIHTGLASSENKLATYLDKIESGLSKHQEEVVKLLSTRDATQTKISALEQELVMKEERIKELEDELKEAKEKEERHVINTLQESFHEHHRQSQLDLQQMYEEQTSEIKKNIQHQQQMLHEILQETKLNRDGLHQKYADSLKELERRFSDELAKHHCDHQGEHRQMKNEIFEKIKKIDMKQRREVADLLQEQFDKRDFSSHRQDEAMQTQKQQLTDLQQRHQKELRGFVQEQLAQFGSDHQEQLKSLVETLWKQETERAMFLLSEQQTKMQHDVEIRCDSHFERLKEKCMKEVEEIKQRREKEEKEERERRFRNIDTSGRTENNESITRKNRGDAYQNEHTRFDSLWCSQNALVPGYTQEDSENDPLLSLIPSVANEAPIKSKFGDCSKLFSRGKVFVSPALTERKWTSKSLFSSNTSPVKPKSQAALPAPDIGFTESRENMELENEPPKKPQPRRKGKKRRARATRKSKRVRKQSTQEDSDQNTEESDSENNTKFVQAPSVSSQVNSTCNKLATDKSSAHIHKENGIRTRARTNSSQKYVPTSTSMSTPSQISQPRDSKTQSHEFAKPLDVRAQSRETSQSRDSRRQSSELTAPRDKRAQSYEFNEPRGNSVQSHEGRQLRDNRAQSRGISESHYSRAPSFDNSTPSCVSKSYQPPGSSNSSRSYSNRSNLTNSASRFNQNNNAPSYPANRKRNSSIFGGGDNPISSQLSVYDFDAARSPSQDSYNSASSYGKRGGGFMAKKDNKKKGTDLHTWEMACSIEPTSGAKIETKRYTSTIVESQTIVSPWTPFSKTNFDDEDDDNSQMSSPSLSLSEAFVKRNVKTAIKPNSYNRSALETIRKSGYISDVPLSVARNQRNFETPMSLPDMTYSSKGHQRKNRTR